MERLFVHLHGAEELVVLYLACRKLHLFYEYADRILEREADLVFIKVVVLGRDEFCDYCVRSPERDIELECLIGW